MTGFFHKHNDFEVHPCGRVSVLHTFLWPSNIPLYGWTASFMTPGGTVVKNLPATQEMQWTQGRSLGQEDPLEEDMASHASILAWKIP